MESLNIVDLNVRLQLSGCRYGELADVYATNLRYKMKCSSESLRNLLLLNYLIETLECYKPLYDTKGIIEMTIRSGNIFHTGNILTFFSNDQPISNPIVLTTDEISVGIQEIVDGINNYQSEIEASYTSEKDLILNIVAPCNNPKISVIIDTGITTINTTLTYTILGKCDIDDNCIKQKDILTLIDKISNIVGLCFQPLGFDYDVPEGYTLGEDGILIPN